MIGYTPTPKNTTKTTIIVMTFQRRFDMVLTRSVGERLLPLIAHNRRLGELDSHFICNLELHGHSVYLRHRPVEPSGRHDPIADLEVVEKFLKLLLLPFRGQQDDEIKNREYERNRDELDVR